MEDLRRKMEDWWAASNSEAIGRKDSQAATLWLIAEYERLTPDERAIADGVLCEWAVSDDESKRFDALAVIDRYRVRAATACLRELAAMLLARPDPGAPFEREKVDRILARLE